MSALMEKIIARLYRAEVPFSRNKNFEAYEDPRVRRAARLCRQLRSLEQDLLAHGRDGEVLVDLHATPAREHDLGASDERAAGAIRPDDEDEHDELGLPRASVRLTIDTLECRRTLYLSRFELDLLLENPALATLLEDAIAAGPNAGASELG